MHKVIAEIGKIKTGHSKAERVLHKIISTNPILNRRMQYNFSIISIYGAWEKYVESLIINYVRARSNLAKSYLDLPDEIKNHHPRLTYSLIANLNLPKYKDKYNEISLIKNLESCLSNRSKFTVNSAVFAMHTANIRWQTLVDMFATVGVDIPIRVSRAINSDRAAIHSDYPLLDDLANRRNDLSHGEASELIDASEMLAIISSMESLGLALYIALRNLLILDIARENGKQIDLLHKVINRKIVCARINGVKVKINDWLVGINPAIDAIPQSSQIKRIEVNHKEINSLNARFVGDLGMEVTFRPKVNQDFLIVSNYFIGAE